jgi:hypothetical protein
MVYNSLSSVVHLYTIMRIVPTIAHINWNYSPNSVQVNLKTQTVMNHTGILC